MSDDDKKALLNTTAPAPNYAEEDDGLSSFSLEQLGKKVGAFGGARVLKFNAGVYTTTDGETITPDREFVVLGLVKLVQKFVGKKLINSFIVPPADRLPDLKRLNEEAPRSEWGVDLNGEPQGPYTHLLVLKLLDPSKLDRYCFITNSNGGGIAFGDITDKVRLIRRLKGRNLTVMVSCVHGLRMKSQYNPHGVPRPGFRVVKLLRLAGVEAGAGQLPAPTPAPTPALAPAPEPTRPAKTATEKLDTFSGKSDAPTKAPGYSLLDLPTESRPSLKDEMADELPF